MKLEKDRFFVYGNAIERSHSRATIRWQNMFIRMFEYDPNEKYEMSLEENPYLGAIFGIKNIVRGDRGEKIVAEEGRDEAGPSSDSVPV